VKEKVEYLKWSLAGDVRTLEQREQTAKTRLAIQYLPPAAD